MKTGIELITEERAEQIQKHGFDANRDDNYTIEELKDVATYLLTGEARFYPHTWSKEWKDKFDKKTRIEKLAIAGALLAAEIDRLQRP